MTDEQATNDLLAIGESSKRTIPVGLVIGAAALATATIFAMIATIAATNGVAEQQPETRPGVDVVSTSSISDSSTTSASGGEQSSTTESTASGSETSSSTAANTTRVRIPHKTVTTGRDGIPTTITVPGLDPTQSQPATIPVPITTIATTTATMPPTTTMATTISSMDPGSG